MPMRAQMSSIMSQIEPEHLELFALEFGKIAESDFVYNLVSTNIGQNVYDLKISNELDYGSNQTSTFRVICP